MFRSFLYMQYVFQTINYGKLTFLNLYQSSQKMKVNRRKMKRMHKTKNRQKKMKTAMSKRKIRKRIEQKRKKMAKLRNPNMSPLLQKWRSYLIQSPPQTRRGGLPLHLEGIQWNRPLQRSQTWEAWPQSSLTLQSEVGKTKMFYILFVSKFQACILSLFNVF